ncbi:FkbM family methyltransferase [bacterium]|nr:FkbM family methyltransferase [bacterium]
MRYAAEHDTDLWDYPIPLKHYPNSIIRADLRESVYAPIYRTGQIPHQIGLDRLAKELIQPGFIVIDVGANIGYTSLMFSNLVGPNGKVIAIEPSPRTYALLSRTLKGTENTICLNVAASHTRAVLDFYVPESLDLASSTYLDKAERVSVQCETIDGITSQFGYPYLVKIDVEGTEPDVFQGMRKTLQHSSLPILIFEALTQRTLLECIYIVNQISVNKYKYYRLGCNGALLNVDSPFGSSDYVALPIKPTGSVRID